MIISGMSATRSVRPVTPSHPNDNSTTDSRHSNIFRFIVSLIIVATANVTNILQIAIYDCKIYRQREYVAQIATVQDVKNIVFWRAAYCGAQLGMQKTNTPV